MPRERKKVLCMDAQRHAEYYGMQRTLDELYAKSKAGETFTGLMELVLSPDNIILAYRNIKTNTGSYTAGTDKQNIGDIGRLSPAEVIGKVRKIVTGSEHGYRPKPVRRKDIPKPNGKTRPLGIPCIWDRLVQQCIKQILEPICEARFSNNSYGFRPNRSVEHAISRTYSLLQRAHLHYVLEFDIKGFFDNVNHSKLIKQLWTLGIQDKQLLFVIRRILKAPIRMPDGSTVYPTKGTPQGGIISPLLANVVLNELDHWIDSQWTEHPVANRYGTWRTIRTSEVFDKSKGYQKMRNSNLKEMFIVRYADDFRIFCRNREDAEKTMEAVTRWITERLKLEVSPEKTRIVNVRKRYSEFLGFKIMVYRKGEKYVVKSHICDKKLQLEESKLVEQAKHIAKPAQGRTQSEEIGLFDEMVLGVQNYYRIATCISLDCRKIHRRVMTVLTNRLNTESGCQLVREGGAMTDSEKERYGASQMVRYVSGINRPIYYTADKEHGGRLPVHVRCIFDEFANVALPDDFERVLATCRSREISINIIIQNMAQLKAMFKDSWENITGNCDTFLYLGGNEQGTFKYVSELLGKETIDTRTRSQSRGRNGSSSTNYQQSGRELLTPDEVRTLDNRNAILLIRGEAPVIDAKYPLEKHPNIKFTEDGGAKPYVHIPGLDYSLDDLDFPVDSLDDIEIIELEETP